MNNTLLGDNRKGALFDESGVYRYRLWRLWDASKPPIGFIMLNPSTADESELDPTCRRCKGYAQQWGFGKMIIGNIFALRATDPSELYEHPDPIGPKNDQHLLDIEKKCDGVIAAWGTHGELMDRGDEVVELLDSQLFALDTTKDGYPNHPLYLPKDIEPEPYNGKDGN